MSEVTMRRRAINLASGPGVGSDANGNARSVGVIRANTEAPLDTNERILADVAAFYTAKDYGLCKIGEMVGYDIPMPRRKITVLLLGNHSAGKSSFINWYIEQTILKTGVAIETQGFSIVTSGKRRDTLKGLATLQLYPHLKPLQDFPGVMDFLATEISTSRAKNFNMVTFIDTPGLVDGDMHYPFDVNETLLWLGEIADLVFVFFDPMGQALCKRTLNIVEKMWGNHSDKMRLYLAKADEAGTETDRQKVLMQIVQELCKRQGLNRSGFDMPTIYLPDVFSSKPTRCANQIDDTCTEISKCIDSTVQNALNTLETYSSSLSIKLEDLIASDLAARTRNKQRTIRGTMSSFVGILIPLILFTSILAANFSQESMTQNLVTFGMYAPYVRQFLVQIAAIWTLMPQAYHLEVVIACVILSAACLIIPRCYPLEKTLPPRQLKSFKEASQVLNDTIERKKAMYAEYLRQSVSEEDYRGDQA